MEMQLNAMQQKAYILSSLGQSLDDTLMAIAMVISLPSSYSTLRTILMSTSNKITIDSVISQVLVEEKSQWSAESQSALVAKTSDKKRETSESKDKKKRPGNCNYCKKPGHWEHKCQKKQAEKGKGKDNSMYKDGDRDKPKPELVVKVAQIVKEDAPALQLFIVQQSK
ncbi:hypothetical protein AZE42_10049 [Rhizopogon vesiculosus]|uniref:CCHC-type domain-containing protein n=1 Tax=Rhizopogon vesiculosus TaxID=180088 RepID=A0A1J8PJU3_9AGAM|nr:hypothetical protein AZE42_10049 [Rhizopogon vesiculosus]